MKAAALDLQRRGRGARDVGFVGEILRAEEDDLAGGGLVEVEDLHAGGDGGLDDDGRARSPAR